MGYASTMITK